VSSAQIPDHVEVSSFNLVRVAPARQHVEDGVRHEVNEGQTPQRTSGDSSQNVEVDLPMVDHITDDRVHQPADESEAHPNENEAAWTELWFLRPSLGDTKRIVLETLLPANLLANIADFPTRWNVCNYAACCTQ